MWSSSSSHSSTMATGFSDVQRMAGVIFLTLLNFMTAFGARLEKRQAAEEGEEGTKEGGGGGEPGKKPQ